MRFGGVFGEDEDAERRQQRQHDVRGDVGEVAERLAEHPSEESAGLAQCRACPPWAEGRRPRRGRGRERQDEQSETDSDAAVVVNRRGVAEQPSGEQEQQNGHHECDGADQPSDRIRADVRSDLVADEEPLVDRTEHGEEHEEEGKTVATIVFLGESLLGAETTEESADAVRQPDPQARTATGHFCLVDVLLRERAAPCRRAGPWEPSAAWGATVRWSTRSLSSWYSWPCSHVTSNSRHLRVMTRLSMNPMASIAPCREPSCRGWSPDSPRQNPRLDPGCARSCPVPRSG